jgi:23S rRNA pseudouridine1911/1915/1917 synthase
MIRRTQHSTINSHISHEKIKRDTVVLRSLRTCYRMPNNMMYNAASSVRCCYGRTWRTSSFLMFLLVHVGVLCFLLPHETTALSSIPSIPPIPSISSIPPVLSTTEALHRIQAWNANANQVYEATVMDLPTTTDLKEQRVAHWAASVAFEDALHTTNAANVACRKERLCLNGNPTSGGRLLQIGDILKLTTTGDSRTTLPSNEQAIPTFLNTRLNLIRALSNEKETHAPLRILYEDDCMAIVCKPAGIHSMSYSTSSLCLDHLLPLLLQPPPPQSNNDALSAPLPRHRLDARVAGPIVVAKTRSAMVDISRSFENQNVEKEYRALVVGNIVGGGGDDFDITTTDEENGSTSHTHVTILDRTPCAVDGILTHVALFPKTGRRHQLRKHCAYELGTPILGDDLYHFDDSADKSAKVRKRIGLYLYCKRVAVPHPFLTNSADGTRRMISAEIDEPLRFARHKQKAAKGYKWQQEGSL